MTIFKKFYLLWTFRVSLLGVFYSSLVSADDLGGMQLYILVTCYSRRDKPNLFNKLLNEHSHAVFPDQ